MKPFLPKKKRHLKKRLKKGIGFRPSKVMVFGENNIPAEAQMEATVVSFDKDGFTLNFKGNAPSGEVPVLFWVKE